MQEKIKVSSLSESQKKEFMKQGKKLHFRSFEVCCPEGYQILYFDPNLLTDEDTTIQTCYGYLKRNLDKIKRLSEKIKRLSESQENINAKNDINDIKNDINDIINEIYKEYDNFKWKHWSSGYLSIKEFIEYGKKIGYRSKSRDKNTAGYHFFEKLRERDKERLSSIILNEESCGKIMDFLRLRKIKMKDRKPHIFVEYADCEMRIDDINRKCLKKNYYDDPNEDVREQDEKEINKISKQRNKELSDFMEQVNNSKICSIIRKHIQDIPNASELIDDNEKLVNELRQYGQDIVVYVLIDKLHITNDKLTELIGEIIGGVSEFNYVKDQVEYDEQFIFQSELARQSEERESLEDYKKNSIENQDKVKNESEAFWPIDSNGEEIRWERCPIVMIKKEE